MTGFYKSQAFELVRAMTASRNIARQDSGRASARDFLPFADAGTAELPLGRLLRLSLFQVSVGMAITLTIGTLNRVMIVELGVSTTLVSIMIGLPLIFAPFRALIGFKSDNHRSVLGWRRVPYMWFGTLIQFGGLAFMPFALLVLSGDNHAPVALGQVAAALAFLMIGAGVQTTQTAGLALATDLASDAVRPRVVALMYSMLLVGMVVSGFVFGLLLNNFTPMRLIQVVQGAAAAHHDSECRRAVETGSPQPGADGRATGGCARFSPVLVEILRHAECPPLPGRGRSGNRRLRHAGHAAGALWRRNSASGGFTDHHPDGGDGDRLADRLRGGGPRPDARLMPAAWRPMACWLVFRPSSLC